MQLVHTCMWHWYHLPQNSIWIFIHLGKEVWVRCMETTLRHTWTSEQSYQYQITSKVSQSAKGYNVVMEQFLTGWLDAKILPAVLAKRKDFRPAEFSFLLLENQDSMESLDFLSLGSSDQQEKLQKLHKQLCIEQAAWRTHLAKLKAHEDAALGDFNQQIMRQQDALDEAWKGVLWEVVSIDLRLMLLSMKQRDNSSHQMRFFVQYYFK